ncbi:MAG: hypothetical protein AAF666_12010 [Pseudomonadota bacterium]
MEQWVTSKNFYYSVEFFSRDVFLASAGMLCVVMFAAVPSEVFRSWALQFYSQLSWINLFASGAAFFLIAVSWSFIAVRGFQIFIWFPIKFLTKTRYDYESLYDENLPIVDRIFESSISDTKLETDYYKSIFDVRQKINAMLYLSQLEFPHGYQYLQRLWGIQAMYCSISFSSFLLMFACALHMEFFSSASLALLFALSTLSYGKIVHTNVREELKVLTATIMYRSISSLSEANKDPVKTTQ